MRQVVCVHACVFTFQPLPAFFSRLVFRAHVEILQGRGNEKSHTHWGFCWALEWTVESFTEIEDIWGEWEIESWLSLTYLKLPTMTTKIKIHSSAQVQSGIYPAVHFPTHTPGSASLFFLCSLCLYTRDCKIICISESLHLDYMTHLLRVIFISVFTFQFYL
jgi:hypothetical protein